MLFCLLSLHLFDNCLLTMGNACEICQEEKGNYLYTPYERQFTNQTLYKGVMTPPLGIGQTNSDAPNPALVKTGIMLPTLSHTLTQIIARQNTIKTFTRENIVGTKIQACELKNKGMCYDGEWRAGVPHGYGKAYYSNGGYFQGYFKNGVADCVDGIFIYPDGTFYRGNIRDSSANGHGMLVYKNGEMIFTGEWMNDKPHGAGKEEYKDGSMYIGSFINGVKEGHGTFKWADGSEYSGMFSNSFANGEGTQKLSNGQVYKGSFFRNKRQGRGVLESHLGNYSGQFVDDKKSGEGEFRFSDGRIFKGTFLENIPEGYGSMTMPNGQVINGFWKNGQNIQIESNVRVNGAPMTTSIIPRTGESSVGNLNGSRFGAVGTSNYGGRNEPTF